MKHFYRIIIKNNKSADTWLRQRISLLNLRCGQRVYNCTNTLGLLMTWFLKTAVRDYQKKNQNINETEHSGLVSQKTFESPISHHLRFAEFLFHEKSHFLSVQRVINRRRCCFLIIPLQVSQSSFFLSTPPGFCDVTGHRCHTATPRPKVPISLSKCAVQVGERLLGGHAC